MITVYPDKTWLVNVIVVGMVFATAAVAAVPTLHWRWKAWPLAVLAALTVPVLISVVLMGIIALWADHLGISGFFVRGFALVLLGLPAALSGFVAALTWLQIRS